MGGDRLAHRAPAADCPWFWISVFATAALGALLVIGPRFSHRQSQIERQFQARERAGQTVGQRETPHNLVTPERTTVTLGPLYVLLGLAVVISWSLFTWRRLHSAPGVPPLDQAEAGK